MTKEKMKTPCSVTITIRCDKLRMDSAKVSGSQNTSKLVGCSLTMIQMRTAR